MTQWLQAVEELALRVQHGLPAALEAKRAARDAEALGRCSGFEKNVTIVVDLGRAPVKVREGQWGEMAVFLDSDYQEYSAEVEVAGQRVETTKLGDLYFQASTRGAREMEGILRGKAVFKSATALAGVTALGTAGAMAVSGGGSDDVLTAAAIGGGSLLVSYLTTPAADIRCWESLPGEVHVAAMSLPAGEYNAQVRFFGPVGNELTALDQRRPGMVVHKLPRRTLWYFRALPTQ